MPGPIDNPNPDDPAVLVDSPVLGVDGGSADTWEVLGNCSCYRCCCCPATVYYPPEMTLTIHNYVPPPDSAHTSTISFTVACYYLDCPRGTVKGHAGTGPCCEDFYFDDDNNPVCTGETGYVMRCHPCVYRLLNAGGTPDIALEYDPDTGGYVVPNPGDVPRVWAYTDPLGAFGTDVYLYVIFAVIRCDCGQTGDTFPAISTYTNPDTGEACGWGGLISVVEAYADGHVHTYVPGSDPPIPYVSTIALNIGLVVGDGSGTYPDPPFRLSNPLDPFKFSCCPLHVRWLLGNYEPVFWCDSGENAHWPDPSEWPPHVGEDIPWNFPPPFCDDSSGGGCGWKWTGTACDCVGPFAAWDCEANSAPDFSYIELSGGASCFLPADYEINCLNGAQADGNANAC